MWQQTSNASGLTHKLPSSEMADTNIFPRISSGRSSIVTPAACTGSPSVTAAAVAAGGR